VVCNRVSSGCIEPIPEVFLIEGVVVAPLWYLLKDAVGAFDMEFGIAGTTDLRSFDRAGDGDTSAMATADESTSIHAVEPVLVVFRLFLVVGAAPSGEIQRFHPSLGRLAVTGVNAGGLVLIGVNEFVANRFF